MRVLAFRLGAVIVLGIALIALLAPWITPADPFAQNLEARMIPPIWMDGGVAGHWLGVISWAGIICRG